MKKWVLPLLAAAFSATAGAQTVNESSPAHVDGPDALQDTGAIALDTLRRGVSFVRMDTPTLTAPKSEAARAREERAIARSSSGSSSASTSSTGRAVKRSKGAELSVQRATDPEGRRHWRVMNRRATRKTPNSPPGTVPVH